MRPQKSDVLFDQSMWSAVLEYFSRTPSSKALFIRTYTFFNGYKILSAMIAVKKGKSVPTKGKRKGLLTISILGFLYSI